MRIEELAERWIELHHHLRQEQTIPDDNQIADAMMQPTFEVMELSDNRPAECMDFVLEVIKKTEDEWILANLAAGPLESMLARHPEQGITLVEKAVAKSPKLKRLLQGVWQNMMTRETWDRLQRLK